MKTIQPVISVFMAMILALFWVTMPAQASGLTNGGYHDDGVGSDGNHYFEFYWYSGDPYIDCYPTSGSDGYIQVWLNNPPANEISGGQWVPVYDVYQSYAGQSGFSQRECQVNVYARNGTGQRQVLFQWSILGTVQSGTPSYTVTF